jgi:hypothetical protein
MAALALADREADIRWDFAPGDDMQDVRAQVSTATPTKGGEHRPQSTLKWGDKSEGLQFANGPDVRNNEGMFLRVADHPALSGHDGDGKGFSSLELSVRVRLDSLGHHQCLLRKTQFASEPARRPRRHTPKPWVVRPVRT